MSKNPIILRSEPEPITAVEAVDVACDQCKFWDRAIIQGYSTSFGACQRWSHLHVEDRGGVQASPFTPITPSKASCECFAPASSTITQ